MKELEMNPYVIQIDKFVSSLDKLSKAFLDLDEKKSFFSEEQVLHMCERVCGKICQECGNRDICLDERGIIHMVLYGVCFKRWKIVDRN